MPNENQLVRCIVKTARGKVRTTVEVSYEVFDTLEKTKNADKNARARELYHNVLYADAPVTPISSFEGMCYWDLIGDDIISIRELREDSQRKVTRETIFKLLDSALGTLDEDELQLMRWVYAKRTTLRSMGETLGVSHAAVRKRRDKVLAKLKKLLLDSLEALDDETLVALGELYNLERDGDE